ncbi:His-Xaa-Ser system protein HxsD [Sandaracinus amylolyticus]|nr:His-Xaa-Ser system protein HxsD [Sandaracinus amylolyticus]
MGALAGMPSDQVDADVSAHAVTVTIDESLYPLDAVYGAAYTFLDRCYVLLDRTASRVRITLTPKNAAASESELRSWVGELQNELLSCAWRSQIVRDNRAVIEAVTLQAVTGAMGPPTLDDLKDFDFSEEPFEDPLGIGLSWEEKYKKKKDEPAAPALGSPEAAAKPGDEGSAT